MLDVTVTALACALLVALYIMYRHADKQAARWASEFSNSEALVEFLQADLCKAERALAVEVRERHLEVEDLTRQLDGVGDCCSNLLRKYEAAHEHHLWDHARYNKLEDAVGRVLHTRAHATKMDTLEHALDALDKVQVELDEQDIARKAAQQQGELT